MRHSLFPGSGNDPRPRARWFMQLVATFGALVTAASALGMGCDGGIGGGSSGGGGGTGGGEPAQCKSELCLAGNVCVHNRCELVCDSHTDCFPSVQDCAQATADDKSSVFVCEGNGRAPIGASCPFGNECDTILACPDGSLCDFAQCNGNGADCTKDDDKCGDDPKCVIGKCSDKSPCSLNGCTKDMCKPLSCVTTGVADADAFCSLRDCHADTDCPGGYFCGITHDPHAICNASPPKGDSNFCGTTTEDCVDPASFTANGATFKEGSVCLLRNVCQKRGKCQTCTTDIDCSLIDGQRCTDVPSSGKVCTQSCNLDKDCDPDFHCIANACVPRFAGGCKGTGKFCEPCQDDEDCGSAGSSVACGSLSGNQKACFDFSFPDACMTNNDCPKSPGGKPGTCLDESFGASPGDANYHRCYFPYNTNSNKFGCW